MSSSYSPADVFSWKGISLYQDERVLKVGTDALLLATWIPTLKIEPKNVLDVGTGSGVLALLMAQAFQQSLITAIDPDEHAVQLALLNAAKSGFNHRIRVEKTNLLELEKSTARTFDLILSNPPFYVNHILPASGAMQSAKHATSSPAAWMAAMSHLVNDEGVICLIVPNAVAFEWIREANANQLYCNNRMDFFSFQSDRQAKRSLLCFTHALNKPQHTSMIMHSGEAKYTMEYAAWLGI